jgi:hypothetical protein
MNFTTKSRDQVRTVLICGARDATVRVDESIVPGGQRTSLTQMLLSKRGPHEESLNRTFPSLDRDIRRLRDATSSLHGPDGRDLTAWMPQVSTMLAITCRSRMLRPQVGLARTSRGFSTIMPPRKEGSHTRDADLGTDPNAPRSPKLIGLSGKQPVTLRRPTQILHAYPVSAQNLKGCSRRVMRTNFP